MNIDWLHCNKCLKFPDPDKHPYMLRKCGHIFCQNCLTTEKCLVCDKIGPSVEIDQRIPQEVRMYFQNPKELLAQYIKNMCCVLDFQGMHRNRLQKMRQERQKQAMKMVMVAQLQLKKGTERERKDKRDKEKLLEEVKRLRRYCDQLEKRAEENERIAHIREQFGTLSAPLPRFNTTSSTCVSERGWRYGGTKSSLTVNSTNTTTCSCGPFTESTPESENLSFGRLALGNTSAGGDSTSSSLEPIANFSTAFQGLLRPSTPSSLRRSSSKRHVCRRGISPSFQSR